MLKDTQTTERSTNFMDLLQQQGTTFTLNGAVLNDTSGSKLVDINSCIPELRRLAIKKDYKELYRLFNAAYKENSEYALRWLLYLRDIKSGIGERQSFRALLIAIGIYDSILLNKILTLDLPSFGRYDDIISIFNEVNATTQDIIVSFIKLQLQKDIQAVYTGNISLLAKWLPSINTSNKSQCRLAKTLAKRLHATPKEYRQTLSILRKVINIVEDQMRRNDWSNICYEHVPSKANLKYKHAFLRHDLDRRLQYLNEVQHGNKVIHASTAFPSDIVNQYIDRFSSIKPYDLTLENMWNNLQTYDGFHDTVIVRDGSGSMGSNIPGSTITALTVADALTLYCCQNNKGQYKDKFITFSSNAKIVDISDCKTLRDKLMELHRHNDCSNTNIQNVFDLILRTAVRNNCSQEDLPRSVLIISDMEFDACTYRTPRLEELFTSIGEEYHAAGYELPRLIFWNVNSHTNGIPLNRHKSGTILMSGYSQTLLQMAMSSQTSPLKVLIETLSHQRYDCVKSIL